VTYRGPRTVIENAYVLPKPASKIPVMLGGLSSGKMLERIARRGDGWLPLYTTPGAEGIEATRVAWNRIRDLAASYGRDADRLELIPVGNVTFTDRPLSGERTPSVGSLDQIVEDIASVAEAGADEVIIDLNNQDWFIDSRQMLDTALEIQQRVAAAGI
jgi:alkanesulfonate monooxygenase SsuD/methylene tetrahydromethanopterin reductase-like flavin-dependent oxidoreductase (luciferase family)